MKKRNVSFELLRIFSMFAIIVMHVFLASGILNVENLDKTSYYLGWTTEAFCYGAVNLYVLISGYFSIKTKFRLSKVLQIWLQVVFYTVVLFGVSVATKSQPFSFTELLQRFLPISGNQYWFVTTWLALHIVSPALNWFIKTVEKGLYKKTLLVLTVLFSLIPFITFSDPLGIGAGYCLYWFCYLYLLGGYIASYKDGFKQRKRFYFGVFIGASLLTALGCFVLAHGTRYFLGAVRGVTAFFAYNAPLVLLASVTLFLFFTKLQLSEKFKKPILFFSSTTFGVYLIHTNLDVFSLIMKTIFKVDTFPESWLLLLYTVMVALAIFVGCALLEKGRAYLFRICKIDRFCDWVEQAVAKGVARLGLF